MSKDQYLMLLSITILHNLLDKHGKEKEHAPQGNFPKNEEVDIVSK